MKILVAVDASDRCMETIRHITQRDPFQKKHLVLYHVFITLPDFYWDIEMEPKSRGAVAHVRAWEAAKKNKIEKFMEKARQMLLDAGFPKEAVTVKIKQSEKGIARDIVEEAKSGYLTVIISRSGEGEFREITIEEFFSVKLRVLNGICYADGKKLLVDGKERHHCGIGHAGPHGAQADI